MRSCIARSHLENPNRLLAGHDALAIAPGGCGQHGIDLGRVNGVGVDGAAQGLDGHGWVPVCSV